MAELVVYDKEIEEVEKMLLPMYAHFSDDAKNVIRCWHSTDVSACAGSGKTTVLLAKLKILADHMPLDDGAGICVLSHTNVAVNEIKARLSTYANRILSYPNFVGTIQAVFDHFITIPYLKNLAGRRVQPVDDKTYAEFMQSRLRNNIKQYGTLYSFLDRTYRGSSNRYSEFVDFLKECKLGRDGSLFISANKKAGSDSKSAKLFLKLKADILKNDGAILYEDTYSIAEEAVSQLSQNYTDLFHLRFRYVLIDEFQDCTESQIGALEKIFDHNRCCVMHIGDPDQAIYNFYNSGAAIWKPREPYLSIACTNRYSQNIADFISNLKSNKTRIISSASGIRYNPVLFVYDRVHIEKVIPAFIKVLDQNNLTDPNGVYKVIGAIKNPNTKGITIGSYWTDFDGNTVSENSRNYYALVSTIRANLRIGKIYDVEYSFRKILCLILHYLRVSNKTSGKEYTVISLKKRIEEKHNDAYRSIIFELSSLNSFDEEAVDCFIRTSINRLISHNEEKDIFDMLPDDFLKKATVVTKSGRQHGNVLIDPLKGRKIIFDTIHGVKGETHDATLYLETEIKRGSDLKRILPYLGIGKAGISDLYDYSRRLAYVAMSRPRSLLCVAMQADTYEKGKQAFMNWDIIDLQSKG